MCASREFKKVGRLVSLGDKATLILSPTVQAVVELEPFNQKN